MPKFISDVQLVGSSTDLTLQDNGKINLGSSNDLKLYHNGTNSNIENFTGTLQIIQNADDGDIVFKSDNGSGGTATYFKLDGSLVNGTTTLGAVNFPDKSKIFMGTGSDFKLYHDGSNSYIENETGNLTIFNKQDDGDIIFASDNGSGGTTEYFKLWGLISSILISKDVLIGNDTAKLKFGAGQDLEIYHDGSHSYIKDTGTGDLKLQASNDIFLLDGSGNVMIEASEGGSVDLFYSGSKKLETTSTGIDVTGTANIDNLTINGAQGTDGQVLTSTGSGVAWEDAPGGGTVDGSGTANDIAMWSDSNTLTDAPIAISGNNATFAGNLYIPEYIFHDGDGDTYLRFLNDRIDIRAGNLSFIDLREDTNNFAYFNVNKDDIDFQFRGSVNSNLIRTDAGNDRVGIGRQPSYALDVGLGTNNSMRVISTDDIAQIIMSDDDTTAYFGVKNSMAYMSFTSGTPSAGFYIDSSGNGTFAGDVNVNGGDLTIVKQNDAPTMTLLHDGTNPSTNDLLFKMQFQSDYDGAHQNWGKIEVDTNASAVRTNMDFYVKSTSGTEELALRLEGQPSAVPNATFAGNVSLVTGKKLYFDNGNTYISEDIADRLRFFVGGAEFMRFTEDTADNIDFYTNATFAGNVTVTGDLVINGTQTILNTQTVEVEDNIIQLNTTQGSPDTATATTSGISIYRGNGVTQASLIFDDGDDVWDLTNKLKVDSYIEADKLIVNNGNILQLHQDSWNSGQTDHYVLYNGWTSSTGDYLLAKSSGNQNGSNGAILISDGNSGGRVYFGQHGNQQAAVDSATAPLATTYAYIGGSGNYFSANTTFNSDITLDDGAGASPNLIFKNSNDDTWKIFHGSQGLLNFTEGTDDRFQLLQGGNAYFHGNVGVGVSPGSQYGLDQNYTVTNPNDDFKFAYRIDANFSGADNTSSDREQGGIYLDIDSSADGDANDEHRLYGIHIDQKYTGFSDQSYGLYSRVETNNITEQTGTLRAVYGFAVADNANVNGGVATMTGGHFDSYLEDMGNINTAHGVFGRTLINSTRTADVESTFGVWGEIQIDSPESINYGDMKAVAAIIDNNEDTTPTFGGQYLYYGAYQGTKGSSAYGVYVTAEDKNYFSNKVGIGTPSPDGKVHISDTSTQLILETPNTTNDIDFRWRENGTNKWNMRYQNSGNHLQFLNQTGSTLTQLSLNADGSSTFAGNILIGNTAVNPASGFADQTGIGLKYSTTVPEIQISSDSTAFQLGRTSTGGHGEVMAIRYASNTIHSFKTNSFDVGTNATFSGKVNIQGSPPTTANTNFNDLVISDSAHAGMSIFSGSNTHHGAIYFGDPDSNNRGQIKYLHDTDAMTFGTLGTTAISIDSGQHVTFNGRILSNYTGTSYHQLQNSTSNGTVLRLLSTGDARLLTLQTDHIYSNGAIYFGDNSHTTNFRGSGYTFSTGNAEFSGALTVVNDSGITVRTSTNGAGAQIQFSDQAPTPSQMGYITFKHSDGDSQGGGASFHLTSNQGNDSPILVLGDASSSSRIVVSSAINTAEVDYGFYNDSNTGMYRAAADQVGLVAGGSRKLLLNSTGVLIQNGSLNVPAGSVTTPSIQVGDTDTGFYDSGSNQIGFSSGGSVAATIDSTRLSVVGYVSATAFRPSNIVTNRIVKFDGTDLDDSLLSDDGSTLTYNGAQIVDAVNSGVRIGEDILFEITEADTTDSLRKKLADRASTSITRVDDATAPAGGCFEFANRYENITLPAFYKVDDNTEFTFEVWVKFISGSDTDQRLYAGASFYDSSKTYLGNSQRYWGESGEQIDSNSRNDGWYHFSGTLGPNRGTGTGDIPTAAEWMKLIMLLNYSSQANTVRYCGLKFYKSGGRQNRMFTSIYRKSLGSQASSVNSWLGKTVMDTSGNLYTPQRLYHYDDTDTYLQFNSNEIDLNTGGTTRLQIVDDEVTIDASCHLKLGDSGDITDPGFLRIRHANSGDGELISLVRSGIRTWRHQINSSGDYEIRNVDGTYNLLTMSANSNLGIGINPGDYKLQTGTGNIRFKHQHNGTARLELFQNRQDLSNVKVWEIAAYNSVEVANIQFYRGGGGSTGYTVFQAKGDNAMALQDIAKFGLNTSSTSEMAATFYNGIYINDTNTRLHEGSGNALRIETGTGHIDIGSMNSSWVHFQANKDIYIYPSSKVSVDGVLAPYSHNTRTLGMDGAYWATTYTRVLDSDNHASRDKLRVWNSGSYAIGMKNGYDYGHLGDNEYAMSFQMSNTSGRGWWWGDTGHSDDQGAMSLTTQGKAVIATSLSIGEGESITSPYSTPLSVVSKNSDTGTAGRALAQFVNEVDVDLSQQKTFVDFVFKDTNTNEIPQVRIGAELGPNAGADTQEKEGEGAFVVYTNNATGTGPTPTGLAERMRVDYRGYLGLGTSTPSTLLHVNGSGTVGRFQSSASYSDLLFTNSGGTGGFLNFGGTTSFNVYVGGGSSSNLEMSLTNTGNLTVSGDVIAYGSPSDIRLKENIKPVENALDKVVKLNGVSFDWKDKEDALDKEGNPVKLKKWKKDIGFIAQEVKEVIPELVRENEEGMLSVRHQGIIPILVESIKELKQEIEELKKQIK